MNQLRQIESVLLRFRRFVRRIAPYRPFTANGQRVKAVCQQFVLAAAHENGGRLASCTECQEVCEKRWGLELERDELSNTMRQLVEEKKLIQDPEGFRLSSACSQELAARVRTSKEVEAVAFGEWEAMVRRTEPSLTDKQIAELLEDLAVWLQKFIVEYGVEAALVLYPEQQQFKKRLEEITARGLGFLPRRHSMVMKVRSRALKAFVDYMTPMQRRHFDNLVVTAYLMSIFTLEPAALDEIRKLTNGQTLYLDTNVVYSLLKLNGARAYAVTRRILALSRALGYRICVTPWTLREMEESVRKARHDLSRQRQSPQSLADIPLNASGSDDEAVIARAVRLMQKDTGISFDDFFILHEQIQKLLDLEGVEVVYDGCDAITQDKHLFDDEIAALERLREGPEKSRLVQEHDVKHRLLIEMRRGDEAREPAKPGYLMLTNDRDLIKYARENRQRHTKELPFALSIHKWGDMVRALVPRTKDYDRTMIRILTTLSFRASGAVSQAEVIEAMRRIELQEQYTVTIQAGIVVNDALGSDGDEADLEAETEPQPAPREREATLESEIRELKAQLGTVQHAQDLRDAEVQRAEADAAERKRLAEIDAAERKRLAETDAAERKRLEERLAATERHLARRSTIFRLISAALLGSIALVAVVLVLTLSIVTEVWPIVAVLIGALFLVCVGVWLVADRKRAWQTFAVVGIIISVVGGIKQLVTRTPGSSKPTAPARHHKP
jgi:hypothetical protein